MNSKGVAWTKEKMRDREDRERAERDGETTLGKKGGKFKNAKGQPAHDPKST